MQRELTIQEWGQMIGRRVTIENNPYIQYELTGVSKHPDGSTTLHILDKLTGDILIFYPSESKVYPHLRRLTSMTVEEFNECFPDQCIDSDEDILGIIEKFDKWVIVQKIINNYGIRLTISKLNTLGFDWSFMIDDGVAIEEVAK